MRQLADYAAAYGFTLTEKHLADFAVMEEQMLSWNKKMNLTAVTAHGEIVVKHFLDSLLALDAAKPPQGVRMLDVGTGAGFPGIPIKIVRADIDLTLLECLKKRVLYLQDLSGRLGQGNLVLHGRAEEQGHREDMRESYGLVTARAVARLPALFEYCLPFVEVGGFFAALKGPDVEGELSRAENALKELGGEIAEVRRYRLPMENRRAIVLIKKISHTSAKYPRNAGKIAKSPL